MVEHAFCFPQYYALHGREAFRRLGYDLDDPPAYLLKKLKDAGIVP